MGGNASNNQRSKSSIKSQAVSLGHVVFTEDPSNISISKVQKGSSAAVVRSSSFSGVTSSKATLPPSRKRSVSEMSKSRGSLWSKVSSTGFGKRRKG